MKNFLFLFLGLLLLCFISTSAYAIPVNFEINAGFGGRETSWLIRQTTGGGTWSKEMATGTMDNKTAYIYNWDLSGGDYLLQMWDTKKNGLNGGDGHAYLAVAGTVLLDVTGTLFTDYYSLSFGVEGSQSVPEILSFGVEGSQSVPELSSEVEGSQPVPEPATMLLFGLGLLGLAGVSRKK